MTKSSENIDRALCDTDVIQAVEQLRETCPDDVVLYARGRVVRDGDNVTTDYVFHMGGHEEAIAQFFGSLLAHEDSFRVASIQGQIVCFEVVKKQEEEL